MSVRMTPEEVWARIESAHTGIITSLRRDGMPIALPMWFCVVDGAVHFRTLARSKKAARLRNDPRISFLVEGGERWAELWAVHLAGTAVFVDDEVVHDKVSAALTAKYSAYRTDRSKMADNTRTHYEQDHVFIRIDAEERVVSWENAKLGFNVMAGHPNLLVADDAGVRVLTIDRPDAKNALDSAMRTAFIDLIADADADPDVHATVITATDPVFSAGVDFKETQSAGATAAAPAVRRPVDWALRPDPAAALRASVTPTICAVNGACVSGALEIALSCTFAIASDRARFADTHARLNVVAGWGLSALLPRAVGVRKAREMSITGNFVDADEALRIGLVNHVVPHDDLLARAVALARDVSPQPAVREVLRLYARGEGLSLSEALTMERDWTVHRTHDPDAFRTLGQQTAQRSKR